EAVCEVARGSADSTADVENVVGRPGLHQSGKFQRCFQAATMELVAGRQRRHARTIGIGAILPHRRVQPGEKISPAVVRGNFAIRVHRARSFQVPYFHRGGASNSTLLSISGPDPSCACESRSSTARAGCRGCLLQSCANAFGDKEKFRSSLHPERRPRVMRQHEDGRVIRRLVAPPALPAFVRPRASDRTEHVAPKNPGTDSGKALLGNSWESVWQKTSCRCAHRTPYVRP